MDIKKLQSLIIDALEDIKAQDIRVYDTTHLTGLFDRIAIASGTSNRQTKALASSVRDKVKENGGNILSIEGEDTGEWVLVDMGDMVVHIMQPAIRAYYRLEEIWGDKEVEFYAGKRISTRTAAEEEAPKKISRHLTTSQTLKLEDDTSKRTPACKKQVETDGAKKAVGKTIKVAPAKSSVPPQKAAATKKAPAKKPALNRVPTKTKAAE